MTTNTNAVKWNNKLIIPTASDYTCRVTEASFGPSKGSGNPMITLSWELVSPKEVEIAGKLVTIAGVSMRDSYHTTANPTDNAKNQANQERIKDLFKKFGLDDTSIDFNNPDISSFRGKCLFCTVKSKKTEDRKAPTTAQIEEAKASGKRAEGDVMKNPITGEELVSYWPEITEIFGLAPEGSVSAPY